MHAGGLKRQTPAVDTFERALEIAKSIGDESAASTIERCIDDISKQQTLAHEETGDQSTVDGQQQSIEADSQQQQQQGILILLTITALGNQGTKG